MANEVLTLWFPWLYPVNIKNVTMILASGSHKNNFDAVKQEIKNGLTQMRIQADSLKTFKLVHCNLKLQDAVIFNLNLVHKTGNNLSDTPRTAILVRFTDFIGKFENGWVK